jgi:hypothetical protein
MGNTMEVISKLPEVSPQKSIQEKLESDLAIMAALIDGIDRCLENKQIPTQEAMQGLVFGWENLKQHAWELMEN